jgi:hypothetical protein
MKVVACCNPHTAILTAHSYDDPCMASPADLFSLFDPFYRLLSLILILFPHWIQETLVIHKNLLEKIILIRGERRNTEWEIHGLESGSRCWCRFSHSHSLFSPIPTSLFAYASISLGRKKKEAKRKGKKERCERRNLRR